MKRIYRFDSKAERNEGLFKWLWYRTFGEKFTFDPNLTTAQEIIDTAKSEYNMTIEQIGPETMLVTGVEGGVRTTGGDGRLDRAEYRHPSYVMCSLTRGFGGENRAFGSNITHNSHVTLRIQRGVLYRSDLHHERYGADHSKPTFVEVRLTPNQFAEMITNMNVGDGVPGTLMHENGKRIRFQPPYEETIVSEGQKGFREICGDVHKKFAKLEEEMDVILAKKNIGKADRERLSNITDIARRMLKDSLPFLASQIEEYGETVTTQARTAVDNAITTAMINLGGEKLAEKLSHGVLTPNGADRMLALDVTPQETALASPESDSVGESELVADLESLGAVECHECKRWGFPGHVCHGCGADLPDEEDA